MEIKLDKYQEPAVKTNSSSVVVVAAAGSGKTRIITERLKYLIKKGVNPENIYAITYTNAAAQEMRERIGNSDVFIGTIHGLANRILIMNGIDTSSAIESENFDNLFSMIKENIYLGKIKMPKVEHLLIDEFQDICQNEYKFAFHTLIAENFYVVGDTRQAIYGFKGASFKYFMDLIEDSDTDVYELINNYRSGQKIINYAQNYVCNMYDIYNTPVRCASGIEGNVEQIIYSDDVVLRRLKQSENYRDWFILSRSNAEVDNFMYLLEKNNIPCTTFKKADLSSEELKAKQEENSVKVLTIHSAKGLENKNVMVFGAKIFDAEERRVCYVAATRAKRKFNLANRRTTLEEKG